MSIGPDTPPPAPRRGLSPWAWVGIGCLSLTVLGFGGCIAAGAFFANQFKQEMNKPFNEEEARQLLKDVPFYPESRVSDEMSRAGRAGLSIFSRMMPAQSSVILALETEAPTESIFNFYDEEMGKLGYQETKIKTEAGVNQQHQYQKDQDMVMVQVQPGKDGKKAIMLMRFNGIKKR